MVAEFSSHFSGPLPPPHVLGQYNQAFPNAAERIMEMAEGQSKHRQDLEKSRVLADIDNERRGQWLAFALALFMFVGGFLLVWQGTSVVGLTLLIAEIAALVGLFIYGKESKHRELERRRQDLLRSAQNNVE
jgi:uncharacterized membrane protein